MRRTEKLYEQGFEGGAVFQLAFPHGKDVPAGGFQLTALLAVTFPGAGALGFPEKGVRLGGVLPGAAVVEVPEAAVDEDDFASASEDQVRVSGQAHAAGFAMEAVPVSLGVQKAAHQQLGLGVFAADAGHVPTAPFSGKEIHPSVQSARTVFLEESPDYSGDALGKQGRNRVANLHVLVRSWTAE